MFLKLGYFIQFRGELDKISQKKLGILLNKIIVKNQLGKLDKLGKNYYLVLPRIILKGINTVNTSFKRYQCLYSTFLSYIFVLGDILSFFKAKELILEKNVSEADNVALFYLVLPSYYLGNLVLYTRKLPSY